MLNRLLAIVAALSVAACAHLDVPADRAATAKTINVVSAIGDEFFFDSFGVLRFSDDSSVVDIKSWGIDQIVVDKVKAKLSKKYSVAPIAVDDAKFDLFVDDLLLPDDGGVAELHRALSPDLPAADLWIVFRKQNVRFGNSDRALAGVGAYQSAFLHARSVTPYLRVWVSVLDGKTMKLLSSGPLKLPGNRIPTGNIPDWGDSTDTWADIPEPKRQQIREQIMDMLARSIDFTLTDAKLATNNFGSVVAQLPQ